MNRTKIALKGAYLSILVTLIQGLLVFWRTSVIIDVFGVEINSISQSANNIFSYLVLLESGLGAAYLYRMYEPYSKQQFLKIFSLYKGLENSLKRISLWMLTALIGIMFIYPMIFEDNNINYFRVVLIIFLLGLRFIIPYYLIIAKKSLLILEEKQYVVNLIDGFVNITIIIFEIILAKYLEVNIEIVLLIGIIITVMSNLVYKSILKLNRNEEFITAHPSYEASEMTKDIIVHHATGLVNTHIDILILSIHDLVAVTTYNAYNIVMNFPITIVNKVITNLRASIGLKLANNDSNNYSVFREILSLNYFVSTLITSVFIIMINSFITLWIGIEFTLDKVSVILFAFLLFHRLIISTIYAVRDGKGLYKESKTYSIIAATVNLVLSIILVKPFGINGLLISTVISSYLVMDIGNINLIYKIVFQKSPLLMYKDVPFLILGVVISTQIAKYLFSLLFIELKLSWLNFFLESIIATIISFVITLFILMLMDDSFKRVMYRIKRVVIKS